MSVHSTTDLRNGHTLTVVHNAADADPGYVVQERDEFGTFIHEIHCGGRLLDAEQLVHGMAGTTPERVACRDCGEPMAYDPDADRCHRCLYGDMNDADVAEAIEATQRRNAAASVIGTVDPVWQADLRGLYRERDRRAAIFADRDGIPLASFARLLVASAALTAVLLYIAAAGRAAAPVAHPPHIGRGPVSSPSTHPPYPAGEGPYQWIGHPGCWIFFPGGGTVSLIWCGTSTPPGR